MKKLTLKHSIFSPFQLFDENGELVGQILFNLIAGFKESIKIKNEIFKIKYIRLHSNEYNVFDQNEKLVIKKDINENRLIYFGENVEIFVFKSIGLFNDRMNLYKDNELVISIKSKSIFKAKYDIKIDENFKNYLVVLVLLNDYIHSQTT